MIEIFAFNGNLHHQSLVKRYIAQFNIKIAVETGTLHGWTSAFLSDNVDVLHTIEIRPEPLEKAIENLRSKSNVHIHCGSSTDVLPGILLTLPSDQPIFFYLDAHWLEYWPLFDELDIIGKYVGKRAVILIDDFKIPNSEYGYDTYNGVPNDIDAIRPYLYEIYGTNYEYKYFDGDTSYYLTVDEALTDEKIRRIHKEWFTSEKQTTGKILIYEKC